MPGGAYSALSGMRMRLDDLDRLAADMANASTAGYKAERVSTEEARRRFDSALDAAIDVTSGGRRTNFSSGDIAITGRDLDVAIEGSGFLELITPGGPRYTRNGSISRQPDGLLTVQGTPVAGDGGEIRVPPGPVSILTDGTVRVGQVVVDRLKVVAFERPDVLVRETGTRFRAPENVEPDEVEGVRMQSGALEQSNVSMIDRMATLVEVSRSFEALQKSLATILNDIDGRAINELGRR